MKILIADDDPFYRLLVQSTLEAWDYEVVAVPDGAAAWEVMQGPHAPPLALLDWKMPGLDGLEVCRRIRTLDRPEPAYVLMLTVHGGHDNIATALRQGADDYIVKPFDREELQARLQVGRRIVGLQASLAGRIKELEAALSVAQKLEAVGRLAGGVAHDFNNLLTVILGCSQVLLEGLPPGHRLRDTVDMIRQAGEGGAGLTRQLLAFCRKQKRLPVPLDLGERVAGLEKMLRRLIGEDVPLEVRLDPAAGPVKADPGQVEQVLLNLVINARDALPGGGAIVVATQKVTVPPGRQADHRGVPPGSYVLLSVRDTGQGMDADTRARLFDPFFTTKEQGKGTGLGLATVYGIVRQSGGHIRVESEPGRGSTFFLYFPSLGQEPAATPPAPEVTFAPGRQGTILLAEDEDPVRSLVRQALCGHGYTVLDAASPAEALRVAGSLPGPVDLLITDLRMPEMTGVQLAARLAPLRPEMKVLYISGYPLDTPLSAPGSPEEAPYLAKPFSPSELLAKVQDVLASPVRTG